MRFPAIRFSAQFALLFLGSLAGAAEPGVTFLIREAGRPERHVLVSAVAHAPEAHGPEVQAAQELARYLEVMTGAQLPVVAAASLAKNTLCVGRLALEKFSEDDLNELGWDGYGVAVGKDGLAITGAKPRGTLYGAYHFLEDLGCGFFTPDCERVPKTPAPVLTYSYKRDRPCFRLRTIGTAKQGGGTGYDFWGNPLYGLTEEEQKHYPRLWIDHTAGFLVPTWKYFEMHPQYFAHTPEGKVLFDIGTEQSALNPFGEDIVHQRTDMVWLCMSHPEVRRIATETLLEWIARQPDHPFFSIHQGDSDFPCQCERCAQVGSVTDNLVAFANALAGPVREKFPGRTLLIFAYGNTMEVLPKIRPAENVCVLFAPIDATSSIHSCLSPKKNAAFREKLLRWNAVAPGQLGVYEYNMDPRTPCLDKMITAIQEYARFHLVGIFYCGAVSMMPELFAYVNAKLLWDPNQDPDRLIREFCAAYYDRAAPAMQSFVQLKRRQVNASGVSFGGFYGAKLGRSFYTRRFCAKAASLLAQAEEAVRDDPPSLARVRRVRQVILTGLLEAWDWTDPSLSKADRAAYAGYLADYLKMKADMETPEEEIEEFLRSTAHLRVGKPWPQDPLIQRFLADPAGTLEQELPAVRASFQQEIPGGWQLPLEAFRGGTGPVFYRWMCPGKMMKGIYGRTSDLHTMRAQLVLSPPPAGAGELVVEGQNCDREGPATRIRIRLNRTVLFEGPNRFAVRGWSTETFPIPAGALRQGENTLTLENLEREARRWFLVSDVKVIRE